MQVITLSLVNFRSFDQLRMDFADGLNIITGPNAAGKTNLIEAIYYLSLARSFKKANDKDLIKIGADEAQILIDYKSDIDGKHTLEATILDQNKTIILDNEKIPSVTKIVGKLLSLVYSPLSVGLLRGEPAERRRYLDTILSSVSEQYLYALIRQKRLLKERNTALYQNYDEDVIAVLTNEISNVSYRLFLERKAFIMKADSLIGKIYDSLFDVNDEVHLRYQTNVPDTDGQEQFVQEMNKKFAAVKSEERIRKTTLIGIQKDDMVATLNGKNIYAYASQGQNRLAALALTLATREIIADHYKEQPILLLDDVMSDLDEKRKQNLVNYLKKGGQIFLTTAEDMKPQEGIAVYSINNGKVERR
jgi:DNA replication and repair protein RecF